MKTRRHGETQSNQRWGILGPLWGSDRRKNDPWRNYLRRLSCARTGSSKAGSRYHSSKRERKRSWWRRRARTTHVTKDTADAKGVQNVRRNTKLQLVPAAGRLQGTRHYEIQEKRWAGSERLSSIPWGADGNNGRSGFEKKSTTAKDEASERNWLRHRIN